MLKDLAVAAKVDAHALKVADDVDDVKAEVIRLILEAKGRGKPSATPPQKVPEKQPAEDAAGKDASSSSDSDSDSDSSDSDEDVEDSSSSDDSDDDSDNDAAEESGEEEEGDGVIAQLQRFKRSTELVLLLHDTTAAERGAVHSWCEEHSDAAVRAWKHTSKTVGTSRVMTVVKPGGDANSVQEAPEKPVQIAEPPAKRPRSPPAEAGAPPPRARPWNPREDVTLALLAERGCFDGDTDETRLSVLASLPGRTVAECRERWTYFVCPMRYGVAARTPPSPWVASPPPPPPWPGPPPWAAAPDGPPPMTATRYFISTSAGAARGAARGSGFVLATNAAAGAARRA